ncbi:hypothetical protein [Virgibacillus sp. L01]|uniref:hypothetical protein n=1 Tax=Virgibacillus sp. L01 TaxID=3457429 RepID=UPI003FD2A317
MSTALMFYSTLDEKTFQKIGYNEQPLKAFYINEENEIVNMSVDLIEGQENTYQLIDPKVHWDPNTHNLNLGLEIEIANPAFLFGSSGIVGEDAVLGIGFRWYSRDSAQQRIVPIAEISHYTDTFYTKNIEVTIERGTIRGRVTFEVVLYLASAGSEMNNVVPGTILGILESTEVLFDGNSSMFPIVEVNDPLKPLWWVVCDFDEPLYEQFTEENAAIVINKGHRNSKFLKTDKGIGSSPILLEIIATGIQIIIEKAKLSGDWQQILDNQTEPGSIGEAIYYFVNAFSWDVSSPENLLKSIREDFDERFK